MSTTRPMTKSPLAVARAAIDVAADALPLGVIRDAFTTLAACVICFRILVNDTM